MKCLRVAVFGMVSSVNLERTKTLLRVCRKAPRAAVSKHREIGRERSRGTEKIGRRTFRTGRHNRGSTCMLLGTVMQLLLMFLSLPAVSVVSAQDIITMLHSGTFTQQLSLVDSDSQQQLALTDEDVRYLGITVDQRAGDLYFSTSNSKIQRARRDPNMSTPWNVTTVVGGHVQVRIEGYNLGTSVDDIIFFSVRGVDCLDVRLESSNSLSCVFGDERVTSDLGEGIRTEDIAVQTVLGGWANGGFVGDFVDAKLADNSLKPIITHVETDGRTISPRAVCFDSTHSRLYYSDLTTKSVNRVFIANDDSDDSDGATQRVTVEYESFLSDVLVYGMAVDTSEGLNGGFLYFSEAQSGKISKVELPVDDGGPGSKQVLVSGLIDPRGVALEPSGGGDRLFFTLRAGSIRAVARDGSVSKAVPRMAALGGGGYEVRRLDSGTLLDGIAISESEVTGNDPTELRLYWTESGRASGIKRSSLDGTRPEDISILDDNEDLREKRRLFWPRGLAFGAGSSSGLLFCEYLGSIRRLPNPAGGLAEVIVEADSYPAAIAVRALVATADREGLPEKFFTQSTS